MKKQDELELKKIFNELKNGNKEAVEDLYKKYNKIVYGIAFSILKNKEDSEDIVQTVFSKIYSMDKEKLPQDKETTWLYSVTKNETLMFLRKKDQSYDIEQIYNIENEKNEIDELIDRESYNQLINKLNAKEKEIVSLKIISNLSFNQISELLGEPAGTIKWRYYKSIYALRIMLSNLCMFVITLALGITTLKQTKKTADKVVKDENKEESNTSIDINQGLNEELGDEILDDELNKSEQNQESIMQNVIIQDNVDYNNTISQDEIIEYNINYWGYGILCISSMFLVITIFSAIILKKYQLKIRKKSSK